MTLNFDEIAVKPICSQILTALEIGFKKLFLSSNQQHEKKKKIRNVCGAINYKRFIFRRYLH